jgi:phage repressor protein C with HTH and peptisase S24 domain
MINFEEIFDRIKYATNTRTQVELAEVLDIRQSSISDAKRRNSVPSDWYMKLFEQYGLNPDWLKKGMGPMRLRTDQGYAPENSPPISMLCEDTARYGGPDAKNSVVPVYSTSSIPGGDDGPQAIGRLSIPQSYACAGIYVVRADSSGMEPCILKDAFVGIDTGKKHVSSGELYGVRIPYEGLVIKRVYIDAQNKKLILRSEKQDLPEITMPLEGHEEHIAGRVAWVLQRM